MVSSAVTGTTGIFLTKLSSVLAAGIFAFSILAEGAAPELRGLNAQESALNFQPAYVSVGGLEPFVLASARFVLKPVQFFFSSGCSCANIQTGDNPVLFQTGFVNLNTVESTLAWYALRCNCSLYTVLFSCAQRGHSHDDAQHSVSHLSSA